MPGLGNGTLWDNSETAYGEVAREILLRHDWVVMHLNGLPWYVQPPLYFWIAALLAKLLGVSSFALRLPSALATIVMGGLTAYAVSREAGTRAGLYAGVVLSTCLMQAVVGRLAIMDALLNLAVAFTIFWWFRALQTGRDRYFIYGWIAVALGFLAKGPVAPVIALLVIVPYYLWERQASRARVPSWRSWLGGIALFIAIIAPWFVSLISAAGMHSVFRLIGHYSVGRYTGTIENQSGPVWYYLPVLILGFFPWIAFFPSAIAFAFERLRRPDEDLVQRNVRQMVRLAIVWIIVPFVFFSFARTKLPNYIALEFPALAVLVALYFDSAVERVRSRSALVSTAVVPVFILLLGIAIVLFSRDNRLTGTLSDVALNLAYVGGTIFIGSIVALFTLLFSKESRAAAPYVLGVAMVIAIGFLALLALPQAERFKPVPHLAHVINERSNPSDAVAIINVAGGNALLFYTRPRIYVLRDHEDGRGVICSTPRTWLIGPHNGYVPVPGKSPKLIARWGKDVLYLYDGTACRS
jgi:4-amino-4-deoxy-L-arabinose transferase-like glycosyltransferase